MSKRANPEPDAKAARQAADSASVSADSASVSADSASVSADSASDTAEPVSNETGSISLAAGSTSLEKAAANAASEPAQAGAAAPLSYRDMTAGIDLQLSRIPEIDLYLDQILTLLNPADGRLTAAMVHNYSKEGLLRPVKGKRYDREHILQLLLICTLKNNLSIQDIKMAFSAFYPAPASPRKSPAGRKAAERTSPESLARLERIYQEGLALKERFRETLPAYLEKTAGPLPETPDERLSLIVGLICIADTLTKFSRTLIEGSAEAAGVSPSPAPGRRGRRTR